jgi:ribonuclease P protein component
MLNKKFRLHYTKDILVVLRRGRMVSNNFLVIKYLANNLLSSRATVVVSTKISKKAVVRNRIKRRLREVLRLSWPQLKIGYDLIVQPKVAILQVKDFSEIKIGLEGLLKQAKILC